MGRPTNPLPLDRVEPSLTYLERVHTELAARPEKHELSVPETVSRLVTALGSEGAERWLMENRAALDSSNQFVDARGLPLKKHRLF